MMRAFAALGTEAQTIGDAQVAQVAQVAQIDAHHAHAVRHDLY